MKSHFEQVDQLKEKRQQMQEDYKAFKEYNQLRQDLSSVSQEFKTLSLILGEENRVKLKEEIEKLDVEKKRLL